MSIRKGSRTIASSVPVTEWGSVDGTLADQVDLKSALDSKASSYSPTFTGIPIAPTAPIDTSNNQIATTKFGVPVFDYTQKPGSNEYEVVYAIIDDKNSDLVNKLPF